MEAKWGRWVSMNLECLTLSYDAVRLIDHEIIRILQQSAVTGREGVSMWGK